MKILFLYDFPLWGNGSGAYMRSLTKEFVKMDHEVGIIAPEDRRFLEDDIKQYKVDPPQVPVFVSHPELKGAKRYSELSPREITDIYQSYLDTTIEAVVNFEPDIIHVNHLSLISWVAKYISALMETKYIITTHGSCLTNTLENKKYKPLTEGAIRHAKAVTMVSKNTKDRFFNAFEEDDVTRSRIISGGVDMDDFPKNKDVSHIEEEHDLDDENVILFAGRITPEKGVKYLIKAADEINGQILIAGEGSQKKELEKIIAKNGLDNVHLLGHLSSKELIPFYYRADVFATPSVAAEAFGLAILEAMAAKTPVIVTKKGALPRLVEEGETGFFVRTKNSSDIAEKCNKILENEEKRKEMGETAREKIKSEFTWAKAAEKFIRLYKIASGQYYKERRENGNGSNSITRMKKAKLIKKAKKENVDFDEDDTTRKELINKIKNKQNK